VELFRVSRDVYGQRTLEGVSWDLLPVFFWAGVALIVIHALYSRFLSRRRR
jgi:hypothetical protein